ncbi:hypothetical protein [Paenibacillus sp. FSL R5-0345]|nr:hypothetical protein [Paenibacillus sp. FSL R5-0345]
MTAKFLCEKGVEALKAAGVGRVGDGIDKVQSACYKDLCGQFI